MSWPIYLASFSVIATGAAARFAIGSVYGEAEAIDLIETLSQTGLYLGSAIASASATTLALMLTLLSLSRKADAEFDNQVYKQISTVSVLATIALICSVLLLLLLVMPVGQFEQLPDGWYKLLYELLFCWIVGVSALVVATITQLFLTIRRVTARLVPNA